MKPESDAWGLVFLGLSLTCITATALFLMVTVNPKDSAYGSTPLIYAALAAFAAVAFNRAAVWVNHRRR